MKIRKTNRGYEASVTVPVITGAPPELDDSGEAPLGYNEDTQALMVWDRDSSEWVAPTSSGAGHVTVANAAALAALTAASYTAGQEVYVTTFGDTFAYVPGTATPDNVTSVAALNGTAGYQWVRQNRPNPSNALVTIWSVDPVGGSDESAGTGASAAAADLVAFKTLQEVKRRLWGLQIDQSVTVRLLRSMVSTDRGAWNTTIPYGMVLTIQGTLGAVTGPGGAIDNTLYSGTLTSAPTVPADVPTADDYEIVDTAIPTSYTASGLLAPGVLFVRTSGALRYWWPLKDLGSKTLRVTGPMSNQTALTTYGGGGMASGDAYSAYQLPSFQMQNFGHAAVNVMLADVYEVTTVAATLTSFIGIGVQRRRNDIGGTTTLSLASQWTNCLIRLASNRIAVVLGASGPGSFVGGGAIGTGAVTLSVFCNVMLIAGCWTSQGVALKTNDAGTIQIEREIAIHDCSIPCLQSTTVGGSIGFYIPSVGQGMSGKGNTDKLALAALGGTIYYGFTGVAPPFNTASTSDANPIQIGSTTYTVAAIPAAADTVLTPSVNFP